MRSASEYLFVAVLVLMLIPFQARAAAVSSSGPEIEEGYVQTADGASLFYQKVGRGRSVIVVPLRLYLFEDFKRLADSYTIISYDVRNRGRSSVVADGAKLTLTHDVEDIEAVRRHFRVAKINLVGYSYMGKVVVMYAMKYPRRVARLIQFGPVPMKFATEYPAHLTAGDEQTVLDPAEVAKVEELRKAGYDRINPKEFCERQWAVTRYRLVGDPSNVSKLGKGPCDWPNEWPVNFERHLRFHFTSAQRLDLTKEEVGRVLAPVLTIHGTKDRNAPYGAGREWALALPNARLLTVSGAAHQVFAEFPETVFPAIRAFLGGRWPERAEKVRKSNAER